jgi:hypothetical protein
VKDELVADLAARRARLLRAWRAAAARDGDPEPE